MAKVRTYEGRRATTYAAYVELFGGGLAAAGRFTDRKQAWNAARAAQAEHDKNRKDPRDGQITLAKYAEEYWLPVLTKQKPNSIAAYRRHYKLRVKPKFGNRKLNEIAMSEVEAWVKELEKTCKANGTPISASTVNGTVRVLSMILKRATKHGRITSNPATAVETPALPPTSRRDISVEQYECLRAALPGPASKLLTEVLLSTGARWGEATEFRRSDLRRIRNRDGDVVWFLRIERNVVDPGAGPDGRGQGAGGGRFIIQDRTKGDSGGEEGGREVDILSDLAQRILTHCSHHSTGPSDLIFTLDILMEEVRPTQINGLTIEDMPANLERFTGANGRKYRHGASNASPLGGCVCTWCRLAFADRLRRTHERRHAGAEANMPNLTNHIPSGWWSDNVWHKAQTIAKLDRRVDVHELRHTYLTWLAQQGFDVFQLKALSGHKQSKTLEGYVHKAKVNNRSSQALQAYRDSELENHVTEYQDSAPSYAGGAQVIPFPSGRRRSS